MVCYRDRTDSGSASAVGNAECFVKIEVAGIDSELARPADANEGVQICAIHIDLATCLMNFFTEVADG
jgi:hypothetical protein